MKNPGLILEADEQSWPLDKPFRIARGTRTEARLIVVTLTDGTHTGRGESVPARRYGQTAASVLEQIEPLKNCRDLDREQLEDLLPPGAARNAVDCALWDLEAKRSAKRAWELARIKITPEVATALTISLDAPAAMAAAASINSARPLLKLKLGGDDLDLERVRAVRAQAPSSQLLIDANESWSPDHYRKVAAPLRDLQVALIEQPFPAAEDDVLEALERPVPVCADESCHTTADLDRLRSRYDVVNIKLDKTGGLTEALRLADQAREAGLQVMIGCMVCTSLGIAPARLLASSADYVDLDGPLLLGGDRADPIAYPNGKIGLPSPRLWG